MRLIAFATDPYPRFPRVIASNRDALFDRPTERLGWQRPNPGAYDVPSGRDPKVDGTWPGPTVSGRIFDADQRARQRCRRECAAGRPHRHRRAHRARAHRRLLGLHGALGPRTIASEDALPHTGIPPARERQLSVAYIRAPDAR